MSGRIAVIGATGMVGSALMRALGDRAQPIIGFDLRYLHMALDCVLGIAENVDTAIIAAAKVGGIRANVDYPGEFIYDNVMIGNNLIEALRLKRPDVRAGYLGSSCVYPRNALQPIKESALGTGTLESTNEPYAMAKIACIKMLEAYSRQYGMRYLVPMPCNLYGPRDHYDERRSHLIPALIHKMHLAKEAKAESVTLWGSGTPRRECMHVDDMAAAVIHLIDCGASGLVNVGTGYDTEIRDIAIRVADAVGYQGGITWDRSEPDGNPRKLLDISLLSHLGWNPDQMCRPLYDGLKETYQAYLREQCKAEVTA